ncbi:hypothetical protein BP6252_00610 [Coleophoma cylindrospora]|uniref:Acyl-CoA desaturase n=1 Tax=Coleophoma cylindrospora TaxID=1849047 RepID=A0A3D8SS42_9HELO|nr:hypothetical protein BP6252_00610 [Coleophoma cylindrospora]
MARTTTTTQSPPVISTQPQSVAKPNQISRDASQGRCRRRSNPIIHPISVLFGFLKSINYWNSFWVLAVPAFGFYLATSTPLLWPTAVFSVVYYFVTGLGITAGYHRLWAHRAYTATVPLRIYLAATSAGALQDSIRTWSSDHRAHHRFTDTLKDPYSVRKGLFYSHIGWLIFKQDASLKGRTSIADLDRDPVVMWQHNYYIPLALGMAYAFPALVAGALWSDPLGGFIYAGILRVMLVQQATFCVNSLAHYLGAATFDDHRSPRDHVLTALLTLGEGYHNFHHEFPNDFRNAVDWWQYDPTKWAIRLWFWCGLVSEVKTFNQNVIERGRMQQEVKTLEGKERLLLSMQGGAVGSGAAAATETLWSWDEFQRATSLKVATGPRRDLILVAGIVYDVASFLAVHPGGESLLRSAVGKDATALFNGGVYNRASPFSFPFTPSLLAYLAAGLYFPLPLSLL